jgi:hypothetical protein
MKEQKRNPKTNLRINHTLTFLTMIILFGLLLAAYSMCLWICIMLTDKLFATDKWYWVTLLYIGGHMLGGLEFFLFLFVICLYFQTKHE